VNHPAPQSRSGSLAEAVANVIAGFLLALVVQRLAYPLFGIATTMTQDGLIAAIFTAASLARSYALRRLFVAIDNCRHHQPEARARSLARRLSTGRP
jgi:hypothetical protein